MKIKYFFRIALWCTIFYSCGNNEIKNYQLKGKLANGQGVTMLLMDVNSRQVKLVDSAAVDKNGEFYFTKKVPEKGFYNVQLSQANMQSGHSSFATIVIDSTEKIVFEADANDIGGSYKISGSIDSDLYKKFNDSVKTKVQEKEALKYKLDSLQQVYQAFMNSSRNQASADSLSKAIEPTFDALAQQYREVQDKLSGYSKNFIDKNLPSFVCIAIVQNLAIEQNIPYYEKTANALLAKYPAIENLKNFKTYVDGQKLNLEAKNRIQPGMPAPEISLNDIDGKPLSLSSLKGKVVIVDFWASWCKPCRMENPFVVELYKKYKNKGLDIFSVSLDSDKAAWAKAIQQDGLTWKNHVSDLKQWQSPVINLYGFDAIPFTCVLDREGKIAAKGLRGPALEEKIRELLGGKM